MLVYQLESTHDSLVIAANLSQPEQGAQPFVAFCSFHFYFSPTAMAHISNQDTGRRGTTNEYLCPF